jgi:hypothetical protein
MESEAEKLRSELQRYRSLLGRVTGRLAVEALKILIHDSETRLRALELKEVQACALRG